MLDSAGNVEASPNSTSTSLSTDDTGACASSCSRPLRPKQSSPSITAWRSLTSCPHAGTKLITSPAFSSAAGGTVASHAEVLALELGISQGQAAWLLINQPQLLHQAPADIHGTLLLLSGPLQCTTAQAAALLLKRPYLIHLPPGRLLQGVQQLATAVGISVADAAVTLRRVPALLDQNPATIAARLVHALTSLGLPEGRRRYLVRRAPLLLLLEPTQITERLAALASALKLTAPADTIRVALRAPGLLAARPGTLTAKLAILAASLRLLPKAALSLALDYPRLLECSEDRLRDRPILLQRLLGREAMMKCNQRIGALVLREPTLMTRATDTLMERLKVLAELLGGGPFGEARAARMTVQRPALLTRSAASLRSSWRALSIWRLSDKQKQDLVCMTPLLLRLSPLEVHGRCR